MSPTVPRPGYSALVERLDHLRPSMAKAVKKIDPQWKARVGQAVHRCFSLAGRTQKEAAALIDRDPAQVGRWITGEDNPQFAAIFAVEELRAPFVIALSELAGVEIETTIHIKRTA